MPVQMHGMNIGALIVEDQPVASSFFERYGFRVRPGMTVDSPVIEISVAFKFGLDHHGNDDFVLIGNDGGATARRNSRTGNRSARDSATGE